MRIGHGYDAHRFCEDKIMRIGGVEIDSPLGLLAHSDGDVLLHALMDALLGAAGERDIGYQFPDNSGEYKNIDSRILLARTRDILRGKNLTVEYADMTVVAQKPKLKPYIEPMRREIARVLEIDVSRVNVKATTEEKMGFTGREEGIAAHAVCLLAEN
ncbi:MAG: 2-C-methyl-D-erythritol 2,4-cyclodiphosphate synthase [Clostridia bacterium]|nr:2-C-methyl-D-erythritol 2,4-cyclodiphosphate synthase [Clostridia bacterium]